jgi:hypothetical protein
LLSWLRGLALKVREKLRSQKCRPGGPGIFGVVMIEALACGTPVVAFNSGSVPEIIENGVTGFVVSSVFPGAKTIATVSRSSALPPESGTLPGKCIGPPGDRCPFKGVHVWRLNKLMDFCNS